MINIIIRIIIGLAIILLLFCMAYTAMYHFDPDCGIIKPSKIVKTIGIIGSLVFAITLILGISYIFGDIILEFLQWLIY